MSNTRHPIKFKKILLASLCETSIAVSSSAISTRYLMPINHWTAHPVFTSSLYMLLNFFIRMVERSILNDPTENDPEKLMEKLFQILRGLTFGMVDLLNRGNLIHETGHLLAANYVYQEAHSNIQIECRYFSACGGKTFFNNSTLSAAGEQLGRYNSEIIVSAAGSAFNNLFAYVALMIAELLPDQWSELSTYLRMSAWINLAATSAYALASYATCTSDSDFCELREHGISPAVFAGSTAGIGLLLHAVGFFCHRSRTEARSDVEPSAQITVEIQNPELTLRQA